MIIIILTNLHLQAGLHYKFCGKKYLALDEQRMPEFALNWLWAKYISS